MVVDLKHRKVLENRTHAIAAAIPSTLVNVSGLMNPSKEAENPPLAQILGEAEDLITALVPALSPIFGVMMTLRYSTQPLRMVSLGNNSITIVSYIKTLAIDSLAPKIAEAPTSLSPPTPYTTLKLASDLTENMLMTSKTSQYSVANGGSSRALEARRSVSEVHDTHRRIP